MINLKVPESRRPEPDSRTPMRPFLLSAFCFPFSTFPANPVNITSRFGMTLVRTNVGLKQYEK